MYATYLDIWFNFFPRESFLILNSVEFFEDNSAVVRKVRRFDKMCAHTVANHIHTHTSHTLTPWASKIYASSLIIDNQH
jgi:hypothetical protein